MKKLILFFALLAFVTRAKAQYYTVTSIPYNPPDSFKLANAVGVHEDDVWSSVITLPFSFTFFGNQYNQLVIGTNQITSFDTSYASPSCCASTSSCCTSNCPWEIASGTPIPTSTFPVGSIMWPYEDVDNSTAGDFSYEVIGTVPNRMFVVTCDSTPYYGSTGSVDEAYCKTPALKATSMMVLYESSNIIDIYIQNKEVCSGWNGGFAIEGIQDATGANAAVVPGRNNGVQWTDTNDAWRFTPITVGVKNNSIANNILLYPDPANDFITLAINNNSSGMINTSVSIYDMYGTPVLQMPVNNPKTEINVSSLAKGVYFIKVNTGHGTEVRKFMKQ